MRATHVPCFVGGSQVAGDDSSGDLKAIYVHDDRIGPYRRAELKFTNPNQLLVTIKIDSHDASGKTEDWIIRHVLIPLHPKIRISFNDLRTITQEWLTPEVQKVVAGVRNVPLDRLEAVQFKYWIELGQEYSGRVLKENLLGDDEAIEFCKSFVLPRYVGVIRYSSGLFGDFDVLMDTTSPRPNYNWIGVVARRGGDEPGELRHVIAEYIAECCRCRYLQ